jgi:hypothetical protein
LFYVADEGSKVYRSKVTDQDHKIAVDDLTIQTEISPTTILLQLFKTPSGALSSSKWLMLNL